MKVVYTVFITVFTYEGVYTVFTTVFTVFTYGGSIYCIQGRSDPVSQVSKCLGPP